MSEPTCPKCNAPMPEDAEICPSCGQAGVPQHEPKPIEGEKGVFFCYRHGREKTRLRCGRCGRAICTDCAVIGPAGQRCPECGKSKVPIRARAIAHQAKVGARNLIGGPMRFLGIIIICSILFSLVRSCQRGLNNRPPVDQEYQEELEPVETTGYPEN